MKYEKPELISFSAQLPCEGAQCANGTADATYNNGTAAPQDCDDGGSALWVCKKGTVVACMIGHSF